MEISEYHNEARRGCLCVPEGIREARLFLKGSYLYFSWENIFLGWGRRWLQLVVALRYPLAIQGIKFGKFLIRHKSRNGVMYGKSVSKYY